jgi:hypothetical protein
MLGAGEPLRVQSGQRILMHLLNASASQIHRIRLLGHAVFHNSDDHPGATFSCVSTIVVRQAFVRQSLEVIRL